MSRGALALLVSLAAFAPAGAARAQDSLLAAPGIEARTGPRSGFSFSLGMERLHDDNILQLTGVGLARFEANPDPPRFAITTVDDDVTGIHGAARWHGRPWTRRETRVSLTYDYDDFERNDVKDWGEYGLSAVQELTARRRHVTTLRLEWNRIPRYYLGQLTDADDSFAAGVRIRRGLKYAQTGLGARLAQSIARGRFEAAAGFEQIRRDYDPHFDERDNTNDQWRFEATAHPFRGSGITLGAMYLVGRLDARGDLPSSPIVDADISYDHHGLGGSLSVPWGRGATAGRFEAIVMPERREYTTTDKFDLNRYLRVNQRLDTTLRVTQAVWGPLDARLEYERLTSDGMLESGVVVPEDQLDFTQNRIGLSLRARWDAPGR